VLIHGKLIKKKFIDFPEVVNRMHEFISKKFPNEKIKILYCAGADHVLKCGCYSLLNEKFGVVVINRPGYEKVSGKFLYPVESKYDYDISSTLIRNLIRNLVHH